MFSAPARVCAARARVGIQQDQRGDGGGPMAQVSEVMTADPRTVTTDDALTDAAKIMRDEGVGAVIVTENQEVWGIVTDRDIAIRGIAEGKDPAQTAVDEV